MGGDGDGDGERKGGDGERKGGDGERKPKKLPHKNEVSIYLDGGGGGLEFSLKLRVQFVDCNHVLGGWLSSVQMDLVEHVAQYISRNRERDNF